MSEDVGARIEMWLAGFINNDYKGDMIRGFSMSLCLLFVVSGIIDFKHCTIINIEFFHVNYTFLRVPFSRLRFIALPYIPR